MELFKELLFPKPLLIIAENFNGMDMPVPSISPSPYGYAGNRFQYNIL